MQRRRRSSITTCGLARQRWLPYNVKHTHGAFRWLIDFGGGQIRDRGAHVMSIANWIMDADYKGPVSIDAKGEPPHDGMYDSAVTMEVTYEFRNPDWTLVWAQPGIPSSGAQARYGAVYWGDTGHDVVTLGDGAGTPDRTEREGLRGTVRLRQGI